MVPYANWVDPITVVPPPELTAAVGSAELAAALARRGITDTKAALAFLDPDRYTPCTPDELPDMACAVERIRLSVRRGERIGVWGDFDVDGQTSTAILVSALRRLGADVVYHIPVRASEGHGVSLPALDRFLQHGVQLVVTCDTGISAHAAVEESARRDIDFIITDHHSLPAQLPRALACVNPQRLPERHPFAALSGAGVAWLVASRLLELQGTPGEASALTDLAALGLVADVAWLRADTRYLVQRGLVRMRSDLRLGLRMLLEGANGAGAELDEETISYFIAPRLNAIGRLGDANPVVEFLLTGDERTARVTASQLAGYNAERRFLCDQVLRSAQEMIERQPELVEGAALVLYHPQWSGGVIGIVASRLVEQFNRPVLLLSGQGGTLRGSARSVQGIDLMQALREQAGYLLQFGGHPMAAGVALREENLAAFRSGLCRSVAAQARTVDLSPQLALEAILPWSSLSLEWVYQLAPLAPFGEGNPAPVFASQNLSVRSEQPLGQSGEHTRLLVEDSQGCAFPVVRWNGAGKPYPRGAFDLAYRLRPNRYQGSTTLQIEWLDAHPVQTVDLGEQPAHPRWSDYREADHPRQVLAQLRSADLAVWAEGVGPLPPGSQDRYSLEQAAALAIWTPPPGPAELRAALERVRPARLLLFSVPPGADDLRQFIRRLAGLVRYCLSSKGGDTSLGQLAAAAAQTESAVIFGLDWLQARGDLRWELQAGGYVSFTTGGTPDPIRLPNIQTSLTMTLRESAAFRDFYRRCEPSVLLPPVRSARSRQE